MWIPARHRWCSGSSARPARNVAITRFDFRQERASDDRFQVLMTVRNYTDAPVSVPASASLDGRALFSRSLELAARDEQTLVLPFPGRALGQAVARIDVDDDLAADNQAFAVVDSPAPLRVLLLTPRQLLPGKRARGAARTELVKRTRGARRGHRAARPHATTWWCSTASPAPRLPPGNFLLIDTVAPGLPFTDAGRGGAAGHPRRRTERARCATWT